jgi:HlyD family secretion protein
MSKTLKWILAILIGFILLIFILVATKTIGGTNATKVAIEEVLPQNITESVSASGKINPVSEVKVSPDISGEILELYVQEGDQVTKGQLLARIDASLYTNNVTRANAQVNQSKAGVANTNAQLQQLSLQLAQAKTNFERNQKLYNEKVISAAEFEIAQASYKNAEASIAVLKENINSSKFNVESAVAGLSEANQSIRRSNIYAPMSGIVSKLLVKQGERVVGTAQMAGTEIMRIADMSLMKVEVEIGENDIQKINLGDTANISVDAYSRRKFKGLVTKIAQSNSGNAMAQVSNDQVSNYTVSIEMDKSSYEDLLAIKTKFPFRPGMSASADILTKHRNGVLAVSINAVTTRDLDSLKSKTETTPENNVFKEYVFVLHKDTARLTEVKTDIQDNNYIEILSGLKKGDKVIVSPYNAIANTLKDKQIIKVVDKKDLFEVEEEK